MIMHTVYASVEPPGVLTSFCVPGVPVPQGSLRSFARPGATYTVSANAGRLERWRGDIRSAARPGFVAPVVPIRNEDFMVGVTFVFDRPKTHLNARGEVAPRYRHRRPRGDTDKLLRAVLDALTLVVWHDDDQVTWCAGHKRWAAPGEAPGAYITIATED